ncbi:23S rRNA (uracil(1939)-C(5))-methyltransferase RlmD [Acidobacterium sp. S8]|uniref:23S rRNA (uracil(1939)-C(5))-methyltransferase RlmD n=1 Tax=Acidobacterium sp. S8 TaxID=1641854 RepID=UPI00131B382D|nr:23S rRNA (uracil(1939)-C(5))-methyltransferase RlmD [Acidobacterium sp. S8]
MKLQIEKCIYGGAGLARAEGKAIFVPFTLPGELVEAHITEDKRSFANAELDAVLEPTQNRATAPCEYFGACGGCQYQHADYSAQIEIKLGILRETLERAKLSHLPEIIPIHAAPFGYRNRARLHIQRQPFALCYKRRASHVNLPITHCPISAPIVEQAIAIVTRIGAAYISEFEEIEFFTNEEQSELLVSLWTRKRDRELSEKLRQFCEMLQRDLPVISGAAVFVTEKNQTENKLFAWQAQALTYRAGEHSYEVSIGSFFQVNRFLVDRLIQLVTADHSGRLAWDLYAGVGLFSLPLREKFEKLIAVEAAPSSSNDMGKNLPDSQAIRSSTLDFLRHKHDTTPDLVVVDPPRSGLGADITALLTKVRPRTMVYVSCDPATLSRDLHALVESGYRLASMHMVDLFPQTFHLESVTMLSID